MERTKSPEFLADELPQDRALRLGAGRLQSAVAELPLRYAPFFARLARLWQVPEPRVLSELTRAKAPHGWRLTLLPGLKTFEVDVGKPCSGRRARLMRLAPGVHFPKHSHRGSEHELYIIGEKPCVAAISEQGIDFTGPVLRWANPFLP